MNSFSGSLRFKLISLQTSQIVSISSHIFYLICVFREENSPVSYKVSDLSAATVSFICDFHVK